MAQSVEQTEDLKKQVYRLDLEKSVLEKAAEVLKKGRGISIQTLTNHEKVVRRLMREQNLSVRKVKKRKYSSYQGEITPAVENVINRDFHAEKPNEKWLTDITEFHIPAGKVYLSPIIDCFDGMPVSWTIGTSPDSALVNTMLDNAISTLSEEEKPLVHSDYAEEKTIPKNCSAV